MTRTLRPQTPPRSARYFQYRSLALSMLSSGTGAAPVSGAWTPITISLSETPSRSWGPAAPAAGGEVVAGPAGPGSALAPRGAAADEPAVGPVDGAPADAAGDPGRGSPAAPDRAAPGRGV